MAKADTASRSEVKYRGETFRTLLEAQWAFFFDLTGLVYTYRPEVFIIDGTEDAQFSRTYAPPFLLDRHQLWFTPFPAIDRSILSDLLHFVSFVRHLSSMARQPQQDGIKGPSNTWCCLVAFGAAGSDHRCGPYSGMGTAADVGMSVIRPVLSVEDLVWAECSSCRQIDLWRDGYFHSAGPFHCTWHFEHGAPCCRADIETHQPFVDSPRLVRARAQAQAFSGDCD